MVGIELHTQISELYLDYLSTLPLLELFTPGNISGLIDEVRSIALMPVVASSREPTISLMVARAGRHE